MYSPICEELLLLLQGQKGPLTHVIVICDVPVDYVSCKALHCVVELVFQQVAAHICKRVVRPMSVLSCLGLEVLNNCKTVLKSLSV